MRKFTQSEFMPHELTPDKIMQLGLGFWGSKTFLSAIELGVFTELAKGPQDGESLRNRLDLHPRSARDFFDALVSLGMLERNNDQYANTPETDLFLDRAKPSYVGGILEMCNARLYGFWGNLTTGLKTGEPQNEVRRGEDFFAAIYADPVRLKQFSRFQTRLRGNPHPGQRPERLGNLRPALRDPGAAPVLSPGALPRGVSAPAHLLVAFVRRPAGRNRSWPNQRPVFSDRASVSCHQRKKGHK
jgi:hypothetical protein